MSIELKKSQGKKICQNFIGALFWWCHLDGPLYVIEGKKRRSKRQKSLAMNNGFLLKISVTQWDLNSGSSHTIELRDF